MWKWIVAQGPTFQALLITALAAVAAALAFSVMGWIGVGLLGLAGLIVAVRIDLTEDKVAGDMTLGSTAYVRQVEELARRDPRQRAAEAATRDIALTVLKTVAGILAAIGLGLFIFGG
ncbi:MAG: hypothetical protein QNJ94_10615 [Alphaproteobacteria bacterium]|nr:hypothetical protein [Alphaproteobacteria bacterium]